MRHVIAICNCNLRVLVYHLTCLDL